MLLNIGDKAPAFSVPDSIGNIISLADFKNPYGNPPYATSSSCNLSTSSNDLGFF